MKKHESRNVYQVRASDDARILARQMDQITGLLEDGYVDLIVQPQRCLVGTSTLLRARFNNAQIKRIRIVVETESKNE